LAQLDKLLSLRTELLIDSTFVDAYLARLSITQQQCDETLLSFAERQLSAVTAFVERLPAQYDSYRLTLLARRLSLDRDKSTFDIDLLLKYLAVCFVQKLSYIFQTLVLNFVDATSFETSTKTI
jgi:hypothetical protein